jgi:hypothetical protein
MSLIQKLFLTFELEITPTILRSVVPVRMDVKIVRALDGYHIAFTCHCGPVS